MTNLREKFEDFSERQKIAKMKYELAKERLAQHDEIHRERNYNKWQQSLPKLTDEEKDLLAKRSARLELEHQKSKENYEKLKKTGQNLFIGASGLAQRLFKTQRKHRKRR